MLFEFIKAIIYGMIEGITEWLPVSSTGHLILLGDILKLEVAPELGEEFSEYFGNMFDFVIQLGAICAVGLLYWERFNIFSQKKSAAEKRESLSLMGKVIVASVPAALIGIVGDALLERLTGKDIDALFYNSFTVAAMLILYGVLFIVSEKLCKGRAPEKIGEGDAECGKISVGKAAAIGCFQALSVIPGTSRSGATILGARLLGTDRRTAAEFSFFMGVPAILGASILKGGEFVGYLLESGVKVPFLAYSVLLVAALTAFCVSAVTIKALLGFVKKHSFAPFGVYRILLGIIVFMMI